MANNKKKAVKSQITDVTKTVEEKASEKPAFSVKRIVLLIVFGIIGIIVVGLTIKFILDIKWNTLFQSFRLGFAFKMGILWFILLFVLSFIQVMNTSLMIWTRLKSLGYKISLLEYVLLAFVSAFFRVVTPSFLGDTFVLIWMKSNGVPTYRVTSILFTNTFFWQVVQYVVTFPAFILVLVYRSAILTTADGIAVFTLLCIGIVIDTFSVIFMYLLCVSKKVHYFLSKVFNWIKKKLHMKYHTKQEIALKYKERAVIKQEFYSYCKDYKTTIIAFIILICGEVLTYATLGVSMYFVQYVNLSDSYYFPEIYKMSFNFGWAFNSANVTFTANRLNFLIPNGEGTLEYILRTYLTAYSGFSATPHISMTSDTGKELIKHITDNSILVWRFFTAFIPAFFGIIALVWWLIKRSRRAKKGQKFFAEEQQLNLNTK